MIKRILFISCCLVTISASAYKACPAAADTNSAGFCPSFKTAAICRCVAAGMPSSMCADMKKIYDRMVALFGSLQRACEYQKDTTTQICIDDWNCYNNGGKDSQGRLCSSTGNRC